MFTLALCGDVILNTRVSTCRSDEVTEALRVVREADVAYGQLEVPLHDFDDRDAFPAAEGALSWMPCRDPPGPPVTAAGFVNVSVDGRRRRGYIALVNKTVQKAVEAIALGHPVVVTDDADREDEGDLVVAADSADASTIAFMAVHCRGLICLALTPERLAALDIGPMVPGAQAETNFTVSIDLDVEGSTGISAADRARTIARAIDPAARPADFRRPGHVFPLRYVPGGVLNRRGHTEAAVDLARLAGRQPAGVICEIINDDGTMARGPSLDAFVARHRLCKVSIEELAAELALDPRTPSAPSPAPEAVTTVATTVLPTHHGRWTTSAMRGADGLEYVALALGVPSAHSAPLVRIHSECLTGDALGSQRCDCGRQLAMAMERISVEGHGIVVYVRGHEGRGIGLLPKLQAYALQDQGFDTVDANVRLGYQIDGRSYAGAAAVLRALDVHRVRLLTNNPAKVQALAEHGVEVAQRVALVAPASDDNIAYLSTKRARMDHRLPAIR